MADRLQVRSTRSRPTAKRIRRAVRRGVRLWRQRQLPSEPPSKPVAATPLDPPSFFTALPRSPKLGVKPEARPISRRKEVEAPKAGFFRALLRLMVWAGAAARFATGCCFDWVMRRRERRQRRAVRLRRILERTGATFIKFGQQASMRIDLLPSEYTEELKKMLDDVKAIPFEKAQGVIRKALGGRPLEEVYQRFDRKPLGSASIACVYLAVLKNGSRVAVKVRRPGVDTLMASDLRALGWILKLLEFFYLPPHSSEDFHYELKTMLLEELDLAKEARFTELFRRGLKKAKFRFASAPKVYFQYSNREVLVAEYLPGVPMTEVLAAVESQDGEALEELRRRRIRPRKLAQRMLRVIRHSGFEGLIFNADPHPANILVQENSRLAFIDFGSCGSFTEKDLVIWRRLLYAQSKRDISAMVDAALALLEPLPPIDINNFSRKLESLFWQDLYAFESDNAQWWERTSANVWISMLKLGREFGLSMNINTLRMVRATMLSDSLAARLDAGIDHYQEYRRYERGADKRARKRLFKKARRDFRNRKWRNLEHAYDSAGSLLFRVQRLIDFPYLQYKSLIDKAAYFFKVIFKLLLFFVLTTSSLMLAWIILDEFGFNQITNEIFGKPLECFLGHEFDPEFWPSRWLSLMFHNNYYQIFVLVVILLTYRRIRHRLEQRDL